MQPLKTIYNVKLTVRTFRKEDKRNREFTENTVYELLLFLESIPQLPLITPVNVKISIAEHSIKGLYGKRGWVQLDTA